MEPTMMNNRQVLSPSSLHASGDRRSPSKDEMHAVFEMCRKNQWTSVLNCVRSNPAIAETSMIMDNHISTTIIHQAITSKGDTKARARVILEILAIAPHAASIKNGYGSLPLHVIAQRNTKMDAPTKELLITELVLAYKDALVAEGGVGKRTPLHIIFTDYISPRVTKLMIDNGKQACFKRDKKGYLPAHVACSRHCSPEKLLMLLKVNPDSLHDTTNDGNTLISLARATATRSHPNYALIEQLKRNLERAPAPAVPTPARVVSHDSGISNGEEELAEDGHVLPFNKRRHRATAGEQSAKTPTTNSRKKYRRGNHWQPPQSTTSRGTGGMFIGETPFMPTPILSSTTTPVRSSRRPAGRGRSTKQPKRKVTADFDGDGDNSPASLLLHFSRQNTHQEPSPKSTTITEIGGSSTNRCGYIASHHDYYRHRHHHGPAGGNHDVSEYFAEV